MCDDERDKYCNWTCGDIITLYVFLSGQSVSSFCQIIGIQERTTCAPIIVFILLKSQFMVKF